MLSEALSRLRFLLRRRPDADLDEELRFHLEQSAKQNIADGMAPEEARRQAMIAFGGLQGTRERSYEQRPGWLIETIAQDICFAFRGFRRNPAFTATAIVTLALAIGTTTAVFSVVDRILFRSLPYAHDDELVSFGLVQSLEKQEFMLGGFYFDWLDHQTAFSAVASQGTYPHACDLVETNPAQVGCLNVQAGFLPLLGVNPIIGRNFLPAEDRPNGAPVALISYGLWQSHYSRDPQILDRLIDVDGAPVRVVGVLPRDFEAPTLQTAEILRPMALDEAHERAAKAGSPMRAFARLKPGISVAQARAAMLPLFLHTQRTYFPPGIANDFHLSIRSVRDRETQDVQGMAWILLGSVLAVLLIACANLASLMMARGAARERELAVRSALGASHSRLVRQTLTEALLLSLGGAVTGLLLAAALLRIFLALAPVGIPFLDRSTVDLRIAGFTLILSLLCGLVFGIVPALEKPGLMTFAARMSNFRKHAVLRRCLVVAQIAVSMVLLSAAGLLMRSFEKMEKQRLGVGTDGVLTVRIALPQSRYSSAEKKMEFYLAAETAVRQMPGIQAIGWTDSIPPGGWNSGRRFSDFAIAGKPQLTAGTGGTITWREVTPDYFRAFDIPIIRGRNFSEEDRRLIAEHDIAANLPVINGQHLTPEQGEAREHEYIVSKLMAARLFPNADPIGQRIRVGPKGAWSTVVGVADNVKNGGLTEQDEPEVYVLRGNVPEDWEGQVALSAATGGSGPIMVVKTGLSLSATFAGVHAQLAHLDPSVPIAMDPLTEYIGKLADRPRFETALLSFFAFTGLGIAIVGLYGVISFLAVQRTREIGVRMALGAGRFQILRLIMREGAQLVLAGSAAGLLAALALSRLLKGFLFEVAPYDPRSFAVMAAVLIITAMAAILLPARYAMQTDPLAALRFE